MVQEIEVLEVDELSTSIAGLDIEYIRTDQGFGPNRLTVAHSKDIVLSLGQMGFSATANTEIPDGTVLFGLITEAVPGAIWCGTQLEAGHLFILTPGTTFVGMEPAGLSGTMLTVPVDTLATMGMQLGIGEPELRHCVEPVFRPEVARLTADLWAATARPSSVEHKRVAAQLLQSAARAMADVDVRPVGAKRRLDRKRTVSDCLDFVESSGSSQPSMSELCRAANASESSVRQAFVEVYDMPPTQYFQHRLLSALRVELLHSDPRDETVTRIASSLGVTHLGRTSGRYRAVFGEVPSETLRTA